MDKRQIWKQYSLSELVDNIEKENHEYAQNAFSVLVDAAQELCKRQAETNPKFKALKRSLTQAFMDLLPHQTREENLLFPIAKQLDEGSYVEEEEGYVQSLIDLLEKEHHQVDQSFSDLATLTKECRMEDEQPFWEALDRLQENLEEHTYKEDVLLFPQILRCLGIPKHPTG